jgi:pSer/pThr/pTyr-binding forkhead associated (FHA) protein
MGPEHGAGRPRVGTVLESVEEIRGLIARRSATVQEAALAPAAPRPAAPAPAAAANPAAVDDATPFRPVVRSSMALLVALDDGEDEGEAIRIRTASFVIGRVEGDLIIPHDPGISSRHIEIVRRGDGPAARWSLHDLNSTNGTFVRAGTVALRVGQELLFGTRRFVFKTPALVSEAQSPVAASTQKWQALSAGETQRPQPSLAELRPDGAGRCFPFTGTEMTLGRDLSCSIVVDDPMVSLRHARIAQDAKGRWFVHNTGSKNGVWARIEEIPLDRGGQFQCGEQRFSIKIL